VNSQQPQAGDLLEGVLSQQRVGVPTLLSGEEMKGILPPSFASTYLYPSCSLLKPLKRAGDHLVYLRKG
jgi:hypothetical protein